MIGTLALTGAGVVAASLVAVRLAPSDPRLWHVDPFTAADPGEAGERRIVTLGDLSPAEALTRLDAMAQEEPRTIRLAGSPEEGRITYMTRTRLAGFPDYTTLGARRGPDGTELAALARLRFGKSDLGVNRARLDRWLAGLERG